MKQKLQTVLYGTLMGMADVIPGVSGATIAYILGFYQDFLKTIKSFDVNVIKLALKGHIKAAIMRPHWGIAIPLLIGMVCGFIIFAKIIPIPQLLQIHPEPIYGLFFGLIVGSLPFLLKGHQFSAKNMLFLALGIAFGLAVSLLAPQEAAATPIYLFICGFLAISAMMLPGISGSFVLLILGQYAVVINAIASFNIIFLLPFILGAFCGLISLSRILHHLISHFPHKMAYLICGILIGSLYRIWPFQDRIYVIVREKQRLISSTPQLPQNFDSQFWLTLALMIIGFTFVYGLEKMQSLKN
ncbi:MAG: DUF368 domain-containing protein [Alphaproteobacteria bacterium]